MLSQDFQQAICFVDADVSSVTVVSFFYFRHLLHTRITMQQRVSSSSSAPAIGGVVNESIASLGLEATLDNFCASLVEEYLRKKCLSETLNTFQRERRRPHEVGQIYRRIFVSDSIYL